MKPRIHKTIEGEIIRRQYFNVPLLWFAVMDLITFYISLLLELFTDSLDSPSPAKYLGMIALTFAIQAIPCLLLSVLNRFFFGKNICTVNDNGIYYQNQCLGWKKIQKIEYILDNPIRRRHHYDEKHSCRAVVHTEKEATVILSAPLYLLSRARKYNRDIRFKLSLETEPQSIIALLFMLVVFLPLFFHFYLR